MKFRDFKQNQQMKIPCKDCLLLGKCKAIMNDKFYYLNKLLVLYERCDLFKDSYTFYLSQCNTFINDFEKEILKIF
jgi:hypothetical protein